MIYRLILLVLLGILRSSMSAPELSQRSGFTASQRETGMQGQYQFTTGVGVMCSPGKGCIGPESTTAQYVAYGETTVCPYLCIFHLSPVLGTFNSTSSFTPKGLICMGRTMSVCFVSTNDPEGFCSRDSTQAY